MASRMDFLGKLATARQVMGTGLMVRHNSTCLCLVTSNSPTQTSQALGTQVPQSKIVEEELGHPHPLWNKLHSVPSTIRVFQNVNPRCTKIMQITHLRRRQQWTKIEAQPHGPMVEYGPISRIRRLQAFLLRKQSDPAMSIEMKPL